MKISVPKSLEELLAEERFVELDKWWSWQRDFYQTRSRNELLWYVLIHGLLTWVGFKRLINGVSVCQRRWESHEEIDRDKSIDDDDDNLIIWRIFKQKTTPDPLAYHNDIDVSEEEEEKTTTTTATCEKNVLVQIELDEQCCKSNHRSIDRSTEQTPRASIKSRST